MSEKREIDAHFIAQKWLGQAIARPLNAVWGGENAQGITGASAAEWLRGHDAMPALERLRVYHRQYWYRLITVMQFDYACTVHVMGLQTYNAWVMQYLEKHPPDSPYLNELDGRFLPFLHEHYHMPNRILVLEAAAYDKAFARAFEGAEGDRSGLARLTENPEAMLEAKLQLADHVTALHLTHDWRAYRQSVLDDENLTRIVAPPAPKPVHGIVYRHGLTLFEKELPKAAVALLAALKAPGNLSELFDRLAENPDWGEAEATELEENLSTWFADFIAQGWVVAAET